MKQHFLAIAFFAAILPISLLAQKKPFVSEAQYLRNNYLPVDEAERETEITIIDTNLVLRKIKVADLPIYFKNHKKELLNNFPNIESTTTIAKVEQSGSLSFAAAAASHKNQQYIITYSYNVFKKETKDTITYKIGYGLRLVAKVTSNASDIDLGNLLKLGVSLKRTKIKGYLHVEVCGLVNPEFGAWVPILTDLTETGINQCTQTFSTIKAKVADAATSVIPQILEIRNDKTVDTLYERKDLLQKFR